MALTRTIGPAVLPVTVEDFRQHLWHTYDDHNSDALLTELLKAATDKAETTISRKLISQTWRINVRFADASAAIVLPFGGFQSLVGVEWFDGSVWTSLAPDDIEVDDTGVLASVSCTYPSATIKQVRVEWVCGYGDSGNDVPGDILMAIKQVAAHWYRVRSASSLESEEGRVVCTPITFTHLLHSHRLNFLG